MKAALQCHFLQMWQEGSSSHPITCIFEQLFITDLFFWFAVQDNKDKIRSSTVCDIVEYSDALSPNSFFIKSSDQYHI